MADTSALERALVNADAAGDTEAARVLAGEITRLRAVDAPKPDKYQQADPVGVNDVVRSTATGVPIIGGLLNKANAATNAALAPLVEPLLSPSKSDISRNGESFGERYAKSLAMQEGSDTKFAAEHPYIDTGAKLAGGVAGMIPAVAAAPGLFGTAGGLGMRTLAGGASNAAIGGVDAAIRGGDPLAAGALGGVLGAGLPVGGALLHGLASPVVSYLRARMNPTGFAQSQVARGVSESGMTPQQIAQSVAQAGNEGQGMFTVADAMGNAGQRMLSTTTRAPGQARTDVVNFLDSRQAGQGRRIANTLAEGFDSPQTAAQTEARLTAQRGADADAAFGAVRQGAGRTDLVPAINAIDRTIGTGPGQALQAANDSVEGALRPFRERLARVNPDDFEAVQRIRFDMADAAQNARQSGYGNRAREIGNAVRALDTAMESASQGYRQANRNFAQASRDIEAVQSGRQAATRGRTEDIIPEFQAQSPAGQGAYRAGYVDPLIQQAQGAAFGANKARPLINDAFQAEAGVMAPGNPLMQRRIGREDTMFQTRNAAMGNSKTVENAADDAAMGLDPTIVGALVTQIGTGNFSGALRTMLGAGQNLMTGNTPAVRQAVADILLTRGGNVNAAQFQRMLDETVRRIQQVQNMARSMGRGAAGGLAVSGPGQNRR